MIDSQNLDVGLGAVVQDFNLLHMLEAVLDTQGITEAGKRLGLSQPAASREMKKLRAALGDPLLKGGVLTPLAESLRPAVARTLSAISEIFRPAPFDPVATHRTFRICTTEYGMATLVVPLIQALAKTAPEAKLVVSHWGPDTLAAMARGDIDVAITTDPDTPAGFHTCELLQERYALLLASDHPLLSLPELSTDDIHRAMRGLPHIVIRFQDGKRVICDDILNQWDVTKAQYVLELPSFLAAPSFIVGTEKVLVLPDSLAMVFARGSGLVIIPLDCKGAHCSYRAIWHERVQHDAAIQWLTTQMEEVARTLDQENVPPESKLDRQATPAVAGEK